MSVDERLELVRNAEVVAFESRDRLLSRLATLDSELDWRPACQGCRESVRRALEASEWLDADRRTKRPWWRFGRRRREKPPWSAVRALEQYDQRDELSRPAVSGPPELRYALEGVSAHGSLVAVISRRAPDHAGEVNWREVGRVTLGDDADSALVAARFSELQDDLTKLVSAARPAYDRAVAEMRRQNMAEAMARDKATEQAALNAGLLEALNLAAACDSSSGPAATTSE